MRGPLVLQDPATCTATEAARRAAMAAQSAAESAQATAEAVRALTQHVASLEQDIPTDQPKLPEWAYHINFAALMNTGNSTSFSGKAGLGVDGNWHDWSLELRANAAYAQNSPLGTTAEPTVFNYALTARGTHFYTPFIGTYLLASVLQDRVASIRMQAFGDLGIPLVWWETTREDYIRSRLRTGVGFRALHEERHQYYPVGGQELSKMIYGPSLTVNFRYGLTKYAYFTEDFDITPDVTSGSDTRAGSTTVLSAQVTRRTELQLAFKVRYIGAPAPDKRSTDTELSAGLNFNI
jgi:putative salt-induced outer membrane protein YdiY